MTENNEVENCINEMLEDEDFAKGLQPLVEFIKEFRKCKQCGEDRGDLLSKCPYCGYKVIETTK